MDPVDGLFQGRYFLESGNCFCRGLDLDRAALNVRLKLQMHRSLRRQANSSVSGLEVVRLGSGIARAFRQQLDTDNAWAINRDDPEGLRTTISAPDLVTADLLLWWHVEAEVADREFLKGERLRLSFFGTVPQVDDFRRLLLVGHFDLQCENLAARDLEDTVANTRLATMPTLCRKSNQCPAHHASIPSTRPA